ncbi:succinylglutamate desuccinylase/aspartoacylase family protein [Flavobacterium sp.]|jgi:predicted deacylase|uniref:succinylglutamate desuccinylase/aspartoacylase family protein n=1 Tax=Flavobacterium sp. TaxID=239 RepID=UPI002A7F06EE|nr:succinylglutamate desuccinylase/aspartoacylase family protein [Flavobacterium sp.]
MYKEIKILGQEILPGDSLTLKMDIARLYTQSKLEIPIIINRAKIDGPCLLILAGIHGDEVNGVEIVRQIVSKGFHIPQKGTIICVPVLNVFGFINKTREFPDGRDLNRMFPGSKTGSLASRFANDFIKQVAFNADYCLDFHTGGNMRFNYAHVRLQKSDKELQELAQVFGTKFMMYAKQRESSFRHAMAKIGKKVLLFEGGKSLSLDRSVTLDGLQGALKVMKHLGLNDFSNEIVNENRVPIIIENSKWIRADQSGMYRSFVKVGEKIQIGDILGSVSDPFGFSERKIKSKYSGYIINNNHLPMVNQGDALMNIGLEE